MMSLINCSTLSSLNSLGSGLLMTLIGTCTVGVFSLSLLNMLILVGGALGASSGAIAMLSGRGKREGECGGGDGGKERWRSR